MKEIIISALAALIFLSPLIPAVSGAANNPFTTKTDTRQDAPEPIIKSRFLVKIIVWQGQLRDKMSGLIRQARTEKEFFPLLVLAACAFAYGVIHSAGPGHGKAVALSYILSCKPSIRQALVFGSTVALIHGFSGIVFVLIVKSVFEAGVSSSLERVTAVTQIISFSLISLFGLFITGRCLYHLFKRTMENGTTIPADTGRLFTRPLLTAAAVGMVPCPGVVMVMLFGISMDLTWLGIVLGILISMGMAATINAIVFTGMSSKAAVLAVSAGTGRTLRYIELLIELAAGLAVTALGMILLSANV